jgi:hypothetical protein
MLKKDNPLKTNNYYMLSRGYKITLKTSSLLSKSGGGDPVRVRFSPSAPINVSLRYDFQQVRDCALGRPDDVE